jgi:hypothetical protein
MSWVGHVTSMGETTVAYSIVLGRPEDMRLIGRLGVYGRIILKRT